MIIDSIGALVFLASLALLFIAAPLLLAYYLVRHRFLSDRMRYAFAAVLVFDCCFLLLLVALDLIA